MVAAERPVISASLGDETVMEGSTAAFHCTVSRGTPPLSVTWLHNALPLAADDQRRRIQSKLLITFIYHIAWT